jgi:hypothetical protein
MELTPEQIELNERTITVIELMTKRGYKQTGVGSNGEVLFFLKKIDEVITVHAFVTVRRLNVELDILGTLGMNVRLATNPILVDTNCFDKTEEELIKYGQICMALGSELGIPVRLEQPIPRGVEETPKTKVEKPISERKKDLWELIRQEGKLKGYDKEMCQEFFLHWTAMNPGAKKFKREFEKIFDVPRRLATWLRNDQKWNKPYQAREEKKAQVQNSELAQVGTKHIKHSDLF